MNKTIWAGNEIYGQEIFKYGQQSISKESRKNKSGPGNNLLNFYLDTVALLVSIEYK